jgi:glycosyltransferase involved in cell wall biosynthesis
MPNFVTDLQGSVAASRTGPPAVGPLRALAVRRVHWNKGFELLLEALAATCGVELRIARDGQLRVRLGSFAVRLGIGGRVAFLGRHDDVPALKASADLLVCPSLYEPLGNVVIEAWPAGLPVVASASDGPTAPIKGGETGILVPLPHERSGGTAALARAIERLRDDARLRARLGRAGRRAYEAEFTEAAVVGRYRRFLEQIAA